MKIFGIKECGIKKYQSGTQEGGIQKQTEEEKFNQYLEQMKKQYPGAYIDSTPIWNYIKPSKEMKSYNEFLNDLKSTNPEEYNRLMENAAQSRTSEISKPWIDADGNVRRSTNVGAGFVSGTDPVGALYVEGVATSPIFNWVGKAAQYGLARAGNLVKAKILSNAIDKSNTTITNVNNLFNTNFINRNTVFGKNSGKAIHADYGDNIGGFTKGTTGASITNGRLVPGHNPNTEVDYTWWNIDKPYATGINNRAFTRYIIKDEKSIPGIINIREQSRPIGQWNGKSGFVLKSERVTPKSVPLDGATIIEYNPITRLYENKIIIP